MKKQITAFITAALILTSITGCSTNSESSDPTNASDSSQTENSETGSENPENSDKSENNSSDDNTPSVPEGEPTFLIGLDGKAILTSEITRLENTDKTAETLTDKDLWAEVYCDGFAYCKEPLNIGYSSYKDSELFEGYKFIGEVPENKNEWKRVNVGDEICGLKVKSASAHFIVNDFDNYTFPERYFDPDNCEIELEGTVEAEGFLQVNNRTVQYADFSELVWFYPTSVNVPVTPMKFSIDNEKGFKTRFDSYDIYQTNNFYLAGEFNYNVLGYLADMGCDMDGIGTGDIAYVRVTLGNIKCRDGGFEASLEKVERLSDILEHIEDDNSTGAGMGM